MTLPTNLSPSTSSVSLLRSLPWIHHSDWDNEGQGVMYAQHKLGASVTFSNSGARMEMGVILMGQAWPPDRKTKTGGDKVTRKYPEYSRGGASPPPALTLEHSSESRLFCHILMTSQWRRCILYNKISEHNVLNVIVKPLLEWLKYNHNLKCPAWSSGLQKWWIYTLKC